VDIDTIAELHARELPRALRSFLRATGSSRYNGGVNISSYLLFTRSYIEQLIALGYGDAKNQSSEILSFINFAGRWKQLKYPSNKNENLASPFNGAS